MREAIGGTWLFQIVIVFILLFAGFMCLTINQSKAFNVKDRIIQTIQSHNGFDISDQCNGDDSALCDIAKYLTDSAYRTTGKCSAPVDGVYAYQGYTREGKITSGNNAAFCIAKVTTDQAIMDTSCGNCGYTELPSVAYYRVEVFYQLDLPIFHSLFNFKIQGDTKTLYVGDIV